MNATFKRENGWTMYATDVPILSEFIRTSPDNLARAITFALLSIRQPFRSVSNAIDDVKRTRRNSVYLWGFKQAGYDYLQARKEELFADCFDAPVIQCIDVLASEVPGLGIVKAAFVAQMLGHECACMDSRNLSDMGLPERAFREFKRRGGVCVVQPETRQRRIADYVQMTIETGGAAHWWDHWCNGIAPSMQMTGDEVSELHTKLVTGKRRNGRL